MDRRQFLTAAGAAASAATAKDAAQGAPGPLRPPSAETDEELSLADIAAAFAGGLTSYQLTQMYLARIDRLDRRGPSLGAVVEINSRAPEIAAALDAERKSRGSRGPLHGVPVLIKDNVQSSDHMMTTAG